jgi:hypothetical protein
MNQALTDRQYSTLIGVIARVPVEEARRLVLERVEAALPSSGKITDEQLLEVINAALASFTPGQYRGDHRGVIPEITASTSVHEASEIYARSLRPPLWVWPPMPPTEKQDTSPSLSPMEDLSERYARSLARPEPPAEPLPEPPVARELLETPRLIEPKTEPESAEDIELAEPVNDEAEGDFESTGGTFNSARFPAPPPRTPEPEPKPRSYRRRPFGDRIKVFFR